LSSLHRYDRAGVPARTAQQSAQAGARGSEGSPEAIVTDIDLRSAQARLAENTKPPQQFAKVFFLEPYKKLWEWMQIIVNKILDSKSTTHWLAWIPGVILVMCAYVIANYVVFCAHAIVVACLLFGAFILACVGGVIFIITALLAGNEGLHRAMR